MKKITLEEIPGLSQEDIDNIKPFLLKAKKYGVVFRLIGSRSNGTYRDDSDIDIVGLYADNFPDNVGRALENELFLFNINRKIELSLMLFPEEIEYLDEEEAKEYGAYSWLPRAVQETGIILKVK